jgi:hypothetical protein
VILSISGEFKFVCLVCIQKGQGKVKITSTDTIYIELYLPYRMKLFCIRKWDQILVGWNWKHVGCLLLLQLV